MSAPIKSLKDCSSMDDLCNLLNSVDEKSITVGKLGGKRVVVGGESLKQSAIIAKFYSLEHSDPQKVASATDKINWITNRLQTKEKKTVLGAVKQFFRSGSDKSDWTRTTTSEASSSAGSAPISTRSHDVFSGRNSLSSQESIDDPQTDDFYEASLEDTEDSIQPMQRSQSEKLTVSNKSHSPKKIPSPQKNKPEESEAESEYDFESSEDYTDISAPDDFMGDFLDEERSFKEDFVDNKVKRWSTMLVSGNASIPLELKETVETLLALPNDVLTGMLEDANFYQTPKGEMDFVKNLDENLYKTLVKHHGLKEPLSKQNETLIYWLSMVNQVKAFLPRNQILKAEELCQLLAGKLYRT